MSERPVVIVGAGPAGLTAGYELSKLGRRSLILEADDEVGGISRTVDYRGFKFDIGGHRFFSKVEYVNTIWHELLGDDLLVRPRLSRIYYRNKFFDYPLQARSTLARLGPVESMRVALSYARARVFPAESESSLEDWVSNRFGRRLFEIFFKTYTEKVWGIPCSEISSDWAAQRIKSLTLGEALRNALQGSAKSSDGEVITTLIEQFLYPRFGPGMMWERCEAVLAERGSPTLRGCRVQQIHHNHSVVDCAVSVDSSGEVTEHEGDHFVSSMPLRELIFSLNPAPPEGVLNAARALRYRDYLTVVLVVDRPDVFPDNWIYIHDPTVMMGRIQNYKNWSAEMVPDATKTSLGLEYFLWEKDDHWTWSHERLIDLGVDECARIGLVGSEEVSDGTVVRMKKAYPVYDHAYQTNLDIIKGYLYSFENLQTVGRNGLHRYNNQDHSMMTGVLAARNIVAGARHDVWQVNTEKAYHEDHRSGVSGDRSVPSRVSDREADLEESAGSLLRHLDARALGVATGIVAAAAFFWVAAVPLLGGGSALTPSLTLLGNYFWGYTVSWQGAVLGLLEAGIGGFLLGFVLAKLHRMAMHAYLLSFRRREEAIRNQDLLSKV